MILSDTEMRPGTDTQWLTHRKEEEREQMKREKESERERRGETGDIESGIYQPEPVCIEGKADLLGAAKRPQTFVRIWYCSALMEWVFLKEQNCNGD